MTILIIWFLAPILLGGLTGIIGSLSVIKISELAINFYRKVKHLDKNKAKDISKDKFQDIIKDKFNNGDYNTVDIGLEECIADIGDKNSWDVVKFWYNSSEDEYLCITSVTFDSIDERFKDQLLTEEIVIL